MGNATVARSARRLRRGARLSARSDQAVGAVFSALADPTRRHVLRSLSVRPDATQHELAGTLPITRQAVSKHLATLREAGLVEVERSGRESRYRLTPEPLGRAAAWMAEVGGDWDRRLAALQRLLSER
jgi:ArsR family transcriptional regulator, cadmium/lead-responsive transcriptional repressor